MTTLHEHGAIVSAATLERPRPASSPSWHPMCIPCDARTPLVVTPMQAVSAGPETCPKVGPAAHPFLVPQSCFMRRLPMTPEETRGAGGRSEPANRAVDLGALGVGSLSPLAAQIRLSARRRGLSLLAPERPGARPSDQVKGGSCHRFRWQPHWMRHATYTEAASAPITSCWSAGVRTTSSSTSGQAATASSRRGRYRLRQLSSHLQ